jgi:signal transduction histidine kinase
MKRCVGQMEAIGRLAGGIAHDFNNLLTSIRGYAELMAYRMPQTDPQRADAEEIVHAVDRAADLTRQLLTFSRRQTAASGALALDHLLLTTEQMLRSVVGEDAADHALERRGGRSPARRGALRRARAIRLPLGV